MSYYYKYQFTSPEPIFALVKEELKSYFDTGAVDDTLFPEWTNHCLGKLGKAARPIGHAMMCMDNFESRLPDDFYAVREAWACVDDFTVFKEPNSLYTEVKQESIRLDNTTLYCQGPSCEFPDIITAIYKTNRTIAFQWKKEYLLTPGNAYPACPNDLYCVNYGAIASNSYDIRDNKFVTTFREGKVYMQYYSNQFKCDNQLIPNTVEAGEYIELYLKYKVFEQLSNQATDETFNQMKSKKEEYESKSEEARIVAITEQKKEDPYRKQRATRRVQNRFRRYDIR